MINFRGKTGFLSAVILVIGLFFVVRNAQAVATSSIRGAAWWGNLGYLYFDCLDNVAGDRLDMPGNLYAPPEPYGFHFFATPCTTIFNHVSLDDNGDFSGTAWNYSKGLVTFNATTTPPDSYSFNTHCPNTCNLSNNCLACYNESDQKVYGWARVINDGTWIRLDSATTTPVALQNWDYQIHSILPGHGVMPGDFIGYATSSIGDLSFNCASEGGGVGTCGGRNYKVYVNSLRVGHLSAPNWSYSQACTGTALKAVLKWYVDSGTQAGYEVVVNTVNNFDTATGNYVCWSGVKTPSVATQYIIPNSDPHCGTLSYNANYYWWIRLYASDGNGGYTPTAWYQYGAVDGHNGANDEETDSNPDSNIKTFTTYAHEFPTPLYSWSPYDIIVGTSTDFTSTSRYYTSAAPATAQDCTGGACAYLWTTTDAGATISNPTNATTAIVFYHPTGTLLTLRVTDPDNYVCSNSTSLNINYNLPIWREVKAQ